MLDQSLEYAYDRTLRPGQRNSMLVPKNEIGQSNEFILRQKCTNESQQAHLAHRSSNLSRRLC